MSSTAIKDFKKVANEQVTRLAQADITEGDVCKLHTDFINVVPLGATDNLDLGYGVAENTAAAGEYVRLTVRGVTDVLLDGTADIAIGDLLQAEGTNAGVLKVIVPTITSVTTLRDTLAKTGPQVVPLAAQATNTATGTLTKCKVNFV